MYTKYMASLAKNRKSQVITATSSYRVAQLARSHRRLAETLLSEIGLHVGQEMLLNALWEGESLSQSELAERLGIQPATLTVSLRPLEKAGYVKRLRDMEDQRVIRVSVTPKGMALRDDVEKAWRKLDEQTVKGLTPEERSTFDALLSRVTDNLSLPGTA